MGKQKPNHINRFRLDHQIKVCALNWPYFWSLHWDKRQWARARENRFRRALQNLVYSVLKLPHIKPKLDFQWQIMELKAFLLKQDSYKHPINVCLESNVSKYVGIFFKDRIWIDVAVWRIRFIHNPLMNR